MSHLLSFSLFLLLVFFFVSIAAQSNSTYPTCPSYNCNGLNISYPFWRMANQITTHLCGYQGFGIQCSNINGTDRPIIAFGGDSYYVQNISYESSMIHLAIYEVSTIAYVPNNCPRVRQCIDLQMLPFDFTSNNVNLSFHFNCTRIPSFATPIPCFELETRKSCVNVVSSEPGGFDWGGYSCDEGVVTAVVEVNVPDRDRLGMEFGGALSSGFELSWRSAEGCGKCEDSNGRCGYNRITMEFMCFCSDGRTTMDHCNTNKGDDKLNVKLVIGVGAALLSMILIFIIYCIMNPSSRKCIATFKHKTEDDKSVEVFIRQYGSLGTKRYNYVDIKKMTNSFQVKLGEGGFGTVFKGKLLDGRLVAVKVLNSSKASGKDFINEVASISKTSHVNIVALLGFCFEYQKRALVYEFMPNGSLEKYIIRHVPPELSEHIGVEKLYEVALGIARGLDYLHRGCNTHILHLDIKPQNILLDEDFCPKIADFGLAKLYSKKESMVSLLEARGTIGYIAPEVFNRRFGRVSHKSDVYSYGMLILEMVGERKICDFGVGSGNTSDIYFPDCIYNRLKEDEFLLDGVTTTEENYYARKMMIVGLWCIQTNPIQRPPISEVIEMLEGSREELGVPPKSLFFSPPQSSKTMSDTSLEVSQDEYNSIKT